MCALTSASFCSSIWSLSITSSSTPLGGEKKTCRTWRNILQKARGEGGAPITETEYITCTLSSVSLSGSFHNAGPESPPGGLACGSCNDSSFLYTLGGSRDLLQNVSNWQEFDFWPFSLSKPFSHLSTLLSTETHTSMVRSLRKSLCSGFSTSTTPHGYKRPRIFFPFTSISWLEPITAKGILAWKGKDRNQWAAIGAKAGNGGYIEGKGIKEREGRLLSGSKLVWAVTASSTHTFKTLVCSLNSSSSSESASGSW